MPLSDRTTRIGKLPTVRYRTLAIFVCVLCIAATVVVGQFRGDRSNSPRPRIKRGPLPGFRTNIGWRGRGRPSRSRDEYPTWDVNRKFENDLFTFVRIEYDSFGPFGWWDRWDNDYPDGDINFSYRLQELTAMEVAPDGKAMRLTDPQLFEYPFIYMAGVQTIIFDDQEQALLRRYLLNGGFLMMDDFWAPEGWDNVLSAMQTVFPDRQPQELTLDHEIFHNVYDLKVLPQVVDVQTWRDGYDFEHMHAYSDGDEDPHFWAYFDDEGRMMALLCHNNDLGDGWEREGENREYFKKFSVQYSYPMGINIITYAMTH